MEFQHDEGDGEAHTEKDLLVPLAEPVVRVEEPVAVERCGTEGE